MPPSAKRRPKSADRRRRLGEGLRRGPRGREGPPPRPSTAPPPGSAAEELRKLVDAVSEKLSGLQSPLLGAVAQGAVEQTVKQVVQQAKAAVEPVIERNPDVFDHLAAAGSELLAAYRSAVQGQEGRWTRGDGRAGGAKNGPDERAPRTARRVTHPATRRPGTAGTRAPRQGNTSIWTDPPRVRWAVAGLDRN